jgi:hypothetical protein
VKTWDCFMFRDELDMLEVRLHDLDGRVDAHVLVESPVTHRGDPKPLHYQENRDRFAPWAGKIIHVAANDLPDHPDPWLREHRQRDAAMWALRDRAAGDDIVLISDVDEFVPWPFPVPEPAVAFSQRLAMYAADWLYPQEHVCTVAARWDHVAAAGSLARVRDSRHSYPLVRGGWHLTWLGGVEAQREKLGVHCHLEMRPDEAERIASGRAYRNGEHQSGDCLMIPVDVDETWPERIWRRQCPESWFRPR